MQVAKSALADAYLLPADKDVTIPFVMNGVPVLPLADSLVAQLAVAQETRPVARESQLQISQVTTPLAKSLREEQLQMRHLM